MKKTIIAASLTALAMGPGFVGASEHAVEGQPITVDGKGDLSPNSEMKLIGGERQKFCVHGIIGARQTGASNEHEHQTQFS